MAAHSEQIQDREKMSKELLEVMAGGRAVGVLKHNLAKQEQMLDKLLDTQKTAAQLIKELMTAEEMVAQKLSDREEELKASFQKLQKIEQSLLQASEEDSQMRTHTNELRKELEVLREEIRQQEKNAEEDACASKSATYLAHLYYQICHIDWDYSCEPTMIKGIHYGPDIAQPISLDSSQYSSCFISDYLWSLVNTSW